MPLSRDVPHVDPLTGSISRDTATFHSELCRRRSCTFMEATHLAAPVDLSRWDKKAFVHFVIMIFLGDCFLSTY